MLKRFIISGNKMRQRIFFNAVRHKKQVIRQHKNISEKTAVI